MILEFYLKSKYMTNKLIYINYFIFYCKNNIYDIFYTFDVFSIILYKFNGYLSITQNKTKTIYLFKIYIYCYIFYFNKSCIRS
jgi:hypothetical protein